jgi:hypothetical protein
MQQICRSPLSIQQTHNQGSSPVRPTTHPQHSSTSILPNQPRSEMCIVMRTVYPSCGHRAPGTADETYYCEAATNRGFAKCLSGEGLDVRTTHLNRGYCDMCCITAITVAKAKGLDMQDSARSMGVNLNDLMRDNPPWRPWWFFGGRYGWTENKIVTGLIIWSSLLVGV